MIAKESGKHPEVPLLLGFLNQCVVPPVTHLRRLEQLHIAPDDLWAIETPWQLDKGGAVQLQELGSASRRPDRLCPPYAMSCVPFW